MLEQGGSRTFMRSKRACMYVYVCMYVYGNSHVKQQTMDGTMNKLGS